MKTLAIVGAQWGDEGKGKVVDALSERADVVARFSGGNNAGHTIVIEGRKIVTHLVPSGCAYPGTRCVLGAGMVLDPDVFADEIAGLRAQGLLMSDELRVSLDAHVLMPYHRWIDGLREDGASGGGRIGTTRRGIGPAYEAKVARRGVRIRDLMRPDRLLERLEHNRVVVDAELSRWSDPRRVDIDVLMKRAEEWALWLRPMACDTAELLEDAIRQGQRVLLEGAQGALLDVDHGTYPYVTSSSTMAGGACTGLGIGPTRISKVWGISKAYATRVGAGPFPTKLSGDDEVALRNAGAEYGATTGRPRDCGWLDLPALAFAAQRNGMTGLCLTKLDVLAMMPRAYVCTHYADGVLPGRDGFEEAKPVLQEIEGWGAPGLLEEVCRATRREELPGPARRYLDLIEDRAGVPLVLVSLGAERSKTLMLADAFD